jgi:hypothetical protein
MSNKTVFANLIISKLASSIGTDGSSFSSSTPVAAQQAIADAVTEFVTSYVWSKSAYVGIMNTYPNNPDPVVSDDHPIMGMCAPVGTPSELAGWLKDLASNIIDGFTCGVGMNMVTFAGPYKPFAGVINVNAEKDTKPAHEANWDNPQLAVWEVICQGIIDMLIGNISGTMSNASRPGISTGTGATSTVVLNYIKDGASRGKRRSEETIITEDYLDWDIDTWNDYKWG